MGAHNDRVCSGPSYVCQWRDQGTPYPRNMAACLRGKREAERSLILTVSYKCIRSKAETEIYMGEKSIKANLYLNENTSRNS